MARNWQKWLYGLLPFLGVVWVIGCGSSTGGGGPMPSPYSMTLSVDPDTMSNGDDPAVVSCHLYNDSIPEGGNQIAFSVASDGALITPYATSTNSDTGTGTFPTVYYAPDSVTAEWDTIFAVFMTGTGDVAASAYTVVRILP